MMNASISALLWCAIQVTVLTCGAAVVYLAARRLHPRAGAAAAGGGLLMVIALTVMAASPWPRWRFSDGSDRVDASIAAASAKSKPSVGLEDGPPPEQPGDDATLAVQKVAEQPSYWSLFVDAINRPQEIAEGGGEVGAKPPLGHELGAEWQAAIKWPGVMVWVFLAGGLVAALRLAGGVASVRRLARSGRAVDDSRVQSIMRELRQRLELDGPVVVRESDALTTPATVGWRRPVVLLPTAWREWSDAELRAVIAHELAHIAGRDYAAWFVARLAVVAHFYHPLVRWLASRLQLEQELAADMAAARVVGDPKQYLHSLAALALSMPANRMSGPARTLFPSRSLLVRRVEMLRTMGVNRSRRGAVRYATFAIVALVGLAAAGLRAPGVDLATSALAQAPSDGAAKTKAAPAAPAERIGLEVVPLDAAYVLSVRPAEIASREESRALTTSFKDLAKLLAESSLSVSDVAEVLVMQYGELDQAPRSNARIVIRFVTPALQKEFLGAFSRKHDLKRSPEDGAWHYEGGRVSKLDASTLVIDQSTTTAGNQPAPLKNAPPEWAGVWQERKEQPVVFAVNVGTAWQSLAGGNADPVAMFGEGAFQTLYPLITDVSWVVADVELKEKIRLSGVFQAKGEESAETVRETLQAAAVLLRNMARLYMKAQPQGPDGNPAPAAQLELQKRLAGEADDLLRSAKFETDGSSVTASFQPTLSTEELAQLIKSVLPSVEEARQAARRQVSMNNLKQLGLAMQNYYAAHSEFPLAAGTKYRVGDEIRTSEHPHSWRVDLLPYLEHLKLYDEYRFDEPWDSDANRKVLAQMPEVFGSPHDEEGDSSNTSYFVFTGPDTVFPGNKAVRMSRIIDGTSKTWMLVEAKRPVPWTKPEDIEYAADKPAPKMEGWVPGSFLAAFVDGHVENMSTDMEEKTLRGFITKAESAGVVTDGAGRYGAESGEPLDFSAPAPTE